MTVRDKAFAALPELLRTSPVVQSLRNSIANDRLSHAILLIGEDLRELEQVALAVAASYLNTDKPENHPDLFTVRPASKARQIRVGELTNPAPNSMRWLIGQLMRTSNQGGAKVGMICEVDRMNSNSANSFLKTLEEPPADTRIILYTDRPYDLLATILSRCFIFRLPYTGSPAQDPAWQDWLQTYQSWIHSVIADPYSRTGRVKAVLGAYGLINRFGELLAETTKAHWEVEKSKLPPNLDSDEMEAAQAGFQKSLRGGLWRDIALATRLAAITRAQKAPFPTQAFAHSMEALETGAGLLELNMKDDTALEFFMLKSLRAWAAA
ncbi:MAG: hypothetical protein LR015_08815 [Verrucomicrobia bacterium]|nr:hypothetical protein [Verrucomicrobiota bacterium]